MRNKKRGSKLYLPSVITEKVTSFNNKMDELCAYVGYDQCFNTSGLIYFFEIWSLTSLNEDGLNI